MKSRFACFLFCFFVVTMGTVMKNFSKIFGGVVSSIGLAAAVYLIFYGLRATGLANTIPIVNTLINTTSDHQIFMISCFAGILYFAMNYLSRMMVALCATVFLFTLIFWSRDRLPDFWNVLVDFGNGIYGLFNR